MEAADFTDTSSAPRDIRTVEVVHLGATKAVWRILVGVTGLVIVMAGGWANYMRAAFDDQGTRIAALEVRAATNERTLAQIEAKLNYAVETTSGMQAQMTDMRHAMDAKLDRLIDASHAARTN